MIGPSLVILIQYYCDTIIASIVTRFYTVFNILSAMAFKLNVILNCIFFCIHLNIIINNNNNSDNNNSNKKESHTIIRK